MAAMGMAGEKHRREIISLNLGQAGVQLGNATWELYCIEHGVLADGTLKEDGEDDFQSYTTFYHRTPNNHLIPRLIMADLEPSVMDEVRVGPYRSLYHPDQLMSQKDDAANNYARGHFSLGKSFQPIFMDRLRRTIEVCDNFEGFIITHSYGGGTGSGLTALIFEKLTMEYGKRVKVDVAIYPSPKLSTAVVEPYNTMLFNHATIDHADLAIMMDNESMYNICNQALDIVSPTYTCINRLIAHVFSSITLSLRYETSMHSDISAMCTNLVPYPRIHFPVTNHAPFISLERASHQNVSVDEITRELFEPESQMIMIDPKGGKYMSCCLHYRGDISSRSVNTALFNIKKKADVNFVDWCPTGFKIGITHQLPCTVPDSDMAACSRSMTMLTNTTSITQAFKKIDQKFDLLFSKRAFVHHFVGEGMEEGEFNEARDNIAQLEKDYEEIGENTAGEDDDEDKKSESMGKKSPQKSSSDQEEYAEVLEEEEEPQAEETEEQDMEEVEEEQDVQEAEEIEEGIEVNEMNEMNEETEEAPEAYENEEHNEQNDEEHAEDVEIDEIDENENY